MTKSKVGRLADLQTRSSVIPVERDCEAGCSEARPEGPVLGVLVDETGVHACHVICRGASIGY